MSLYDSFHEAFQYPGISDIAFNSFLLPDIVVIAILSIVVAYTKKDNLEYVILGGFSFATLYCLNASILTKGGILPTIIMTLGLFYNIFLISNKRMFRESSSQRTTINMMKTIVQITCVWTITLFVLPLIIMKGFGAQIPTMLEANKIGITLFIMFSLVGLYSAVEMVRKGKGTPLPLDQTSRLVKTGPYAIIRNPMAFAGIGQGLSLTLLLSSIHVLLYTILGAALWQFVVRPIEENDMSKRFGVEYEEYKNQVSLWIPKKQ